MKFRIIYIDAFGKELSLTYDSTSYEVVKVMAKRMFKDKVKEIIPLDFEAEDSKKFYETRQTYKSMYGDFDLDEEDDCA